jgi:hypothetical protein
MSNFYPHPATRPDARPILLGGLVPLALALAISLETPDPTLSSVAVVIGLTLGVVAVIALMFSARYTLTLTLLALYLGLLDGPIKLEATSHHLASSLRDVLIGAVVLGMLMRLGARSGKVVLPPLSGWVLAFAAVVLVEALNPHTGSILKSLGGYRQQLEWVPFFFFGYLIMRSKQRFRQLFLLLGVIALANGLVGAYQSRISATQLASWGPGYNELVKGGATNGITARTYSVEGVAHARPPALGSDAGFGGGVGVLALPGLMALLATGRLRRRWPVLLCCVGALLGVATSASRTSTVVAVLVLVGFALLSLLAGLRVSRPLAGLVAIALIALGVGAVLLETDGSSIFARQETLTSVQRAQETGGAGKERSLSQIPSDLVHAPFGLGLGTAGSASGFGGHQRIEIEGQKVEGGGAYNLLVKELGLPGLALWLGLSASTIILAIPRLRRVRDVELRTYLVGILTAFIALGCEGFSAPTLAVTIGAFLWFAPGVVAYWFAGTGWSAISGRARNLANTITTNAPTAATSR